MNKPQESQSKEETLLQSGWRNYVLSRLQVYGFIAVIVLPVYFLLLAFFPEFDGLASWVFMVYAAIPLITFELSAYLFESYSQKSNKNYYDNQSTDHK